MDWLASLAEKMSQGLGSCDVLVNWITVPSLSAHSDDQMDQSFPTPCIHARHTPLSHIPHNSPVFVLTI